MAEMLRRGSRIAVVAPSGIPDAAKLSAGIRVLEEWGYSVEVLPGVAQEFRYFAGQDAVRLADLQRAFSGEFDAVWMARGGSGLSRIIEKLNWQAMHRVPFFGFSDGTTLLNALAARGFPAVHAPVLNALASLNDDDSRAALRQLLAEERSIRLPGEWISGIGAGVRGEVFGGNLCVLASLCGTPAQLDGEGRIILLEDIGETPYKVDRLLVQCRDSGMFEGAVAIVLGDFIGATPPGDANWAMKDVFLDVLGALGVPILSGLPVGHGPRNFPVPLGVSARFDGDALVVAGRSRQGTAMATPLSRVLDEATGTVAPNISACVLHNGEVSFSYVGQLLPRPAYDLASLTKVLCTTELALRMVESGQLALDDGHALWHPGVTLRQILQHSAGYLWWKELWHGQDRAGIFAAALAEPLVSAPGSVHTYSDLGFLSLGAVIEAIAGERLDTLWARAAPEFAGRLRWGDAQAMPTGEGPAGVVNDMNARGMGGIAPHAGLFADARTVAECADRWLDGGVPLAAEAFNSLGVGSHALGWDTPSGDQSSAGPRPPADAVGHTGFTGTSIWMSPSRRVVAVLLTNRVALGRDPEPIRRLRHTWHQLVWDEFAG